MSSNFRILALDPATTIGYAYSLEGVINIGHYVLSKGSRAEKLREFDAWLHDSIDSTNVDIIVFERPYVKNHRSAYLQYGMTALIEMCDIKCAVLEVNPNVVKKFATGKGNAPKEEMLAAASRNVSVATHDEADAYWILQYFMENHEWQI